MMQSQTPADMMYRQDSKTSVRNKEMYIISTFFSLLFLSMIVYLIYFVALRSDEVLNDPHNLRLKKIESTVIKGSIRTRDGEILACSEQTEDGSQVRSYPYNNLFSHVVGYSKRGQSGLEKVAAHYMLTSHGDILNEVENDVMGKKTYGDDIYTTLDLHLQTVAYEQLGDFQGAIVAIEPSTGKTLCMVSKPDFNPNEIDEIWDSLVSDQRNSNLLNRAIQGLYPPGSTFKVITALEYLREYPEDMTGIIYDCEGEISIGDFTIHCSENHAHGPMTLVNSLCQSCNTAFSYIGTKIKPDKLFNLCSDFMFNKKLDLGLESSTSSFRLNNDSSDAEIVMTAFGQGKTLITPMQNAMITAAVANGGVMMKPYLIDKIKTPSGLDKETFKPKELNRVMTKEEADIMTEYLSSVVNFGTAYLAQSDDYQIAGKTGSAQYTDSPDTHAWFVGFAPAEDPKIAVSVIVEQGGSGGRTAAPIAKAVMDAYILGEVSEDTVQERYEGDDNQPIDEPIIEEQ